MVPPQLIYALAALNLLTHLTIHGICHLESLSDLKGITKLLALTSTLVSCSSNKLHYCTKSQQEVSNGNNIKLIEQFSNQVVTKCKASGNYEYIYNNVAKTSLTSTDWTKFMLT